MNTPKRIRRSGRVIPQTPEDSDYDSESDYVSDTTAESLPELERPRFSNSSPIPCLSLEEFEELVREEQERKRRLREILTRSSRNRRPFLDRHM